MELIFKRFRSLALIAMICLLGLFSNIGTVNAKETSPDEQYTVLVLDTSGSMSGQPMTSLKNAANSFCSSLCSSSNIAIVRFGSSASIECEFTTDLNTLKDAIDRLGTSGTTDALGGLQKANELLEGIPSDFTRNIVFFSDGEPDSEWATLDYAENLSDINIFTVGFFEDLYGSSKERAQQFMEDLANAGYKDVSDIEDFNDAFDDVADIIKSEDYRTLFINSHRNYVNSNKFNEEVYAGYKDGLNSAVEMMNKDGSVQNYKWLNFTNKVLNLDLTLSEQYELILGEIMVSSTGTKGIEENFSANLYKVTEDVLNSIKDALDSSLDSSKVEASKQLEQLVTQLKGVKFGTKEYVNLTNKVDNILDEFIDINTAKKSLEGTGIAVDVIGDVADTTSKTIRYYTYAEAYKNTSTDFAEILLVGLSQIHGMDDPDDIQIGTWGSTTVGTKPKVEMVGGVPLSGAIQVYIDNMEAYKKDGMKAVAEYAINNTKEQVNSKIGVFVVDALVSKVPIFNKLPALRAAIGTIQTVTDIFTDIDDKFYDAGMVGKLYYMTEVLNTSIGNYAYPVKTPEKYSSDDAFRNSSKFDLAFNMYKNTKLMAQEYAKKYANQRMKKDAKAWFNKKKKTAMDNQVLAELIINSPDIYNMLCHDSCLEFDPQSGSITYTGDTLRSFFLMCPVDVVVYDNYGNRIATLTDSGVDTKPGYEPYFQVIPENDENTEFMKSLLIPEDYRFEIEGTSSGNMSMLVQTYKNGDLVDVDLFEDIPVTSKTYGTVNQNSDDPELTVDDKTYDSVDITKEAIEAANEPDPDFEAEDAILVYRLYNPQSGEHLYTHDGYEYSVLGSQGWTQEGTGWMSPTAGEPVYRLYSPVTGEHLYTKDTNEYQTLLGNGNWVADFNGDPIMYSGGTGKVYRLYNEQIRMHLLTTDENENNVLHSRGWTQEGIGLNCLDSSGVSK